jgi:Spy/CpxP family protein refolding chaperone
MSCRCHPTARLIVVLLAAASVALSAPASAARGATPPAPAAPAPPRCDTPEHRQFDFWIGDWDVTNPAGARAGANSITSILDGCVLQEHWKGARGGEGTSFNLYDRTDHQWHQVWVDSSGSRLELAGGLRDGAMILSGVSVGATGERTLERITWTPLSGGRVRQLWEQSKDDGKTWTVAFDGQYARHS